MKESTEQPAPHSIDGIEEMLCPHCMKPVDAISHFCSACGGPTSMHSAIDPMGQVYTAGHAYRSATDRPTKFIVVLGIWLIFATPLLMVLFAILISVIAPTIPDTPVGNIANTISSEPPTAGGLIAAPLSLVLAIIYYLILYKTTRAYIRARQRAQTACNGCDEPIGDIFHACWKCGTPYEDDQQPDPQPIVDPLVSQPAPEQYEGMPQDLTGQACPECGAFIDEHVHDLPDDSFPAELSRREDRIRRVYLFTWLASWISMPIVSSVLKPLIPYGETGGVLIHTILFGVLIVAVISPLAFFYNLLPDNSPSR